MAISRTIIAAYKRCYTSPELLAALKIALNDRATGVQLTQISFQDGGGSGQIIAGDPNEVIEILELCLQELADVTQGPQPLAAGVNFSTRRSET